MNEAAPPTPFSRLTDSLEKKGDNFVIGLPADWLQGRTAYGGLSTALCLGATLKAFSDMPPLRSIQVSFVGPATGELSIAPTMLRRGKSAAFAAASLVGDGGLAVHAQFCFGADRSLPVSHNAVVSPKAPSVDSCPPYYTWPNRPNFMSHFDGRLAAGARSGTPGVVPEMLVWLRHRDRSVGNDLVGLIAMADALPPASLIKYAAVPSISTMTWSINLLDPAPASADGWWLVHCAAETLRDGYSSQNTQLWNSDGQPILVARQTVAIFAKTATHATS